LVNWRGSGRYGQQNKLPAEFGPYSDRFFSHQVFVLAPFHANESKNIFDKIRGRLRQCPQAREVAAQRCCADSSDSYSRNDFVVCDQWTKGCVRNLDQGLIDGIYLYQLAVADLQNGHSAITHTFAVTQLPSFSGVAFTARWGQRGFTIDYPVGVVSMQPTRWLLLGGPAPIELDNGYVYQRGELFRLCRHDPFRPTNVNMTNVASGIVKRAVLELSGGEHILQGIFPPVTEITLID
jgi:hypothetical protein